MKITIELYGSAEGPDSAPTKREVDRQIAAIDRATKGPLRSLADITALMSVKSILRGIRAQLYK